MSKYANLPDIDDAPDVYETADVPEEHAYERDSDSDYDFGSPSTNRKQAAGSAAAAANQDIDKSKLDTADARERFKNSTTLPIASTSYVYKPRKAVLEDDVETPVDRLRRLRLELADLEDQVASMPKPDSSPDDNDKGKRKRQVTPAALLQQINMLKIDADKLQIPDPVPPQGIAKVDDLDKSPSDTQQHSFSTAQKQTPPSSGLPLSELDQRLARLEKALGTSSSDVSLASTIPLSTKINRIEAQLSLLSQPRQLDSVSRRVKILLTDLEKIHEIRRKTGDTRPISSLAMLTSSANAAGADPSPATDGSTAADIPADLVPRLEQTFEMLPRLNALSNLVPKMLNRLRSLAALHDAAASFAQDLESLKAKVESLDSGKDEMKELLERVETSLKENEEKTKANLRSLEERLDRLVDAQASS